MWIRALLKGFKFRQARFSALGLPSTARLHLEGLEERNLPSNFAVTELGLISANDINNHNQVVGQKVFATGHYAALWQSGTAISLGSFGTGLSSEALAVSDAGHIVGMAQTNGPSFANHAFMITPEDTDGNGNPDRWFRDTNADGRNDLMIDLGAMGGTDSVARGVNATGQVVGYINGTSGNRGFVWNRGQMMDIGTFGGPMSMARAINDAGQVIGFADNSLGGQTGFLINPEDTNGDSAPDRWFRDTNGDGANDLMVPVDQPLDINAAGQIVSGGGLWTPTTPNGTTGTYAAFGSNFYGLALNNAARAVGFQGYGDEYYGYTIPAVWDGVTATDLNALVPVGNSVSAALAINDAGLILGTNEYLNGQYNAPLLLTPTNLPSVSISGSTVGEGEGTAFFTVSLSNANTVPVTVRYATVDGSALAGKDYGAASGLLTFAPGETTRTVGVAILEDRDGEGVESFRVQLSDPTNAFLTYLNYQGGAGTINDNEPAIGINYSTALREGQSGTRSAVFTVTLSSSSDLPVTVNYATADGDTWDWSEYPPPAATAGSDYLATAGTLTFAPGETTKTVTVPVLSDRTTEEDEMFSLDIFNPIGGFIPWGHGVATIVNDDPTLWLISASTIEGNTGTSALDFIVNLSIALDEPLTVSYATGDGTALAGMDYQAASGTIAFAPGEMAKTVRVLVTGDRIGEMDEFLYLNLSQPSSGSIGGQGSGVIVDNEPRISISDVTKTEGQKGQTTLFTFTVTLSFAYDQQVTLSFRTTNGTATANNKDYVARTGTLTFAPGETTKTITIEVKGDSNKEKTEYFYVDLDAVTKNFLFEKKRGTGTILNDD